MQNSSLKKYLFYIIITAAFLIFIPYSVCSAANQSEMMKSGGLLPQGKGPSIFIFAKGTTVTMLQKELVTQPHVRQVAVYGMDGIQKIHGLVESGDIVETLDENGNVLNTVIAEIQSDGGSSGAASSGGTSSGGQGTDLPDDGGDYVLSGKTTVEELSEKISSMPEYDGCEIKIEAYGGKQKQSGLLCTGDTLELLDGNGKEAKSVNIIIPGDLTRCGTVSAKGCDMLYGYLSCNKKLTGDILRAADVNGDGTVDTSDLLLMKRSQKLSASSAS